jgi:hypothetical protein
VNTEKEVPPEGTDGPHEEVPPEVPPERSEGQSEGNSRWLFFMWLFTVGVVITALVLIWIASRP